MFEVVRFDGVETVTIEIFAERGNAEAYARELEGKDKRPVAYYARRARG
jgi:hypothetical protein